MRVIHLLDHSLPKYSGYSFRSRYIVRMLSKLGCEVQVVTSARHDEFSETRETIDGLTYHRTVRPDGFLDRVQLKVPFWRERIMTAAMARRLEEVAREFRPDVIHAHSPFFNGQAALRVGRRLGVPVVYEIRAFWEDDAVDKNKIAEGDFVYRQVKRLETEVVQRADRVVCICEGLRKDLAGRGIPEDKITVVKNGVEIDSFQPRAKDPELLKRYGIDPSKRVLGFIGSFFFYEGLPELVDAAARLAAERDDFAMLLIGAGEDEDNVRAAVARHGLEDRVILTGRVPHEQIQDHYAAIDVFVYPRRSKRLTELVTPLKPLEAMAMERTVIGSDVGGIRELLEECGVGALYRSGDEDDLVRVLSHALERTPADLAEEGAAGRVAVLDKRNWEKTLQPVLSVYEGLVGRAQEPLAGAGSAPSGTH